MPVDLSDVVGPVFEWGQTRKAKPQRAPAVKPYDAHPRVCDWFGLWAIEEVAGQALRFMVERTPPGPHMAAAAPRQTTYSEPVQFRGKNIARINVVGPLMRSESSFGGTSTVQLRKDIQAADRDPSVNGILLAIDSPGGTVDGTWELAKTVREVAKGRRTPIHAWVAATCASAAYWMASQTQAIHAGNPMAQIGSIGTYLAVYDYSAAAERDGVKVHLFTTGELKGMGVPGTPLTDPQKNHLQSRINKAQGFFDDAVKAGRKLTASQLESVRTGAAWFAEDAESLRLIDGVKSLDEALAAVAAAV